MMRSLFFTAGCFVSLTATALAQTSSPEEFLQQFIKDSSRIPAYEEGLRVMDQIASMTPNEVRTTLPVIFEALHSPHLMAQLEGALGLNAVSLRSDGPTLLMSQSDEILKLLHNDESRLKLTAVIVTENIHTPAAKVIPIYLSFVADQGQPASIKPALISSLVSLTKSVSPDMARVFSGFFSNTTNPSIKIDFLNAVASHPLAGC